MVQENVGNGGSHSVGKWIKQLEPGFLPQQIVPLEETGEDMADVCLWISASKKKFRSEMEKKLYLVQCCHWSSRDSLANLFIVSSDMCVYVYEYVFLSVSILFSKCCVLGSQCLN